MEIRENILLAPYTTFRIGGPARWFMEATNEAELTEAVAFARSQHADLFVLGGGSNLLVADKGFPGVVVHVANKGIREQVQGETSIFTAAAGENWDNFVNTVVDREFAGVECMAGIPGTIGGTPVQNVGAYGQEVSSTIVSVRALDRTSLRMADFAGPNCEFGYRRSIFNTTARERYIVTEVSYRLRKHGAPCLAYPELSEAFAGKSPKLAQVSKMVRDIRRKKGMLLMEGDPNCRSAGSFFKNPVVSESLLADISARVTKEANLSGLSHAESIPHFHSDPGTVKLLAGWLIEHAGFPRGFALGQAAISTKHTLAIVNRGDATAAGILALRDEIRKRVLAQFGICLEQEPVYVSGP
ncbi:MAG TPA: UDP-N-acetylmuramate dehydrogenase [Acidobacteriaceae bacterium]|nr:UDP-N-acetylmuramate dehydrogenase [Acidobacteriaceae bacterium]